MTAARTEIVSLPSPLVSPLRVNHHLVAMVAEVLQQPLEDARRLLYEEELFLGTYFHKENAQRWKLEPNVWSEKLVEFYRETKAGILGNAVWNRRREKSDLRAWIGTYLARDGDGPLDILTIGDGSGFDSLYLALCGHRVTYSEECRSSIAFAERLFAQEGVSVKIARSLSEESPAAFDVVVCLDVLEHVAHAEQAFGNLKGNFRKKLIVSVPNIGCLRCRVRLALFGKFPLTNCIFHVNEHLRHWTISDFRHWMKRESMRILRIDGQYGLRGFYRWFPGLFAHGVVYTLERAEDNAIR